ncbi:MAG: hypothetical protein J2P48_16265 [Alphaproteobacteria bacterium]|nr:hypothetical protein [Alphaproteobacteria bacterium]
MIHNFEPLRLPAVLLRPERRVALAEALVVASWHRTVGTQFQKAPGASEHVIAAARNTPLTRS